jgi:hypothetical protein
VTYLVKDAVSFCSECDECLVFLETSGPIRVSLEPSALFSTELTCCLYTYYRMWAGYLSQCSVWLRTGRPGFDFSYSLCAQTGSGAHPTSYTVGTGGSFPGGKAGLGRDADHSPPSSAELKKEQELYPVSPKAPPWRVTGPLYLTFTHTPESIGRVDNFGTFLVVQLYHSWWSDIVSYTHWNWGHVIKPLIILTNVFHINIYRLQFNKFFCADVNLGLAQRGKNIDWR